MKIEILQAGKVLPSVLHDGKFYMEAPEKGEYIVRLQNTHFSRRLVVLSVDGVNVIDGKDASYNGAGYVLRPWETVDVPGWRRSNQEVAAFEFVPEKEGYAEKTGRGTANVGIIGVAVFDEKVKFEWPKITEKHIHHHHDHWPWYPNRRQTTWPEWFTPDFGGTWCSTNTSGPSGTLGSSGGSGIEYNSSLPPATASTFATRSTDVGTGYGKETTFHTTTTEFEKATSSPAIVLEVRYATRERLASWGIVMPKTEAKREPRAFPAENHGPFVAPPPGWRTSR